MKVIKYKYNGLILESNCLIDSSAKDEIPFNYEGLVIKPTGHHYDENSYNLVLPTKEEGYIEFICIIF